MPYTKWFNRAIKKAGPVSEKQLYLRTLIVGLAVFAAIYAYIIWLKIPNPLNKAIADTSIILIGFSMLLSSICYFWNFLDSKIIYRKHIGLVGFAFMIAHIGLSFSALKPLLQIESWQKGVIWPIFTGLLAAVIFAVMAVASNKYAANKLGGKMWRYLLRTGYLGLILVFAHVYLLKIKRILPWIQGGMKTPPSTSVLVLVFLTLVLLMRVALWISLKRKQRALKT